MSSAFKNVEPRRAHKERAQPRTREKFGLLEKKKDWLQRAKDYHKKQDRIAALKRKAEFRNPDEFYFKMNNTRTEGGVHQVDREHAPPSKDMLKVLKTQDIKYVQAKAATDKKHAEKLRSSLHQLDGKKRNQHLIFVDNEEEAEKLDPVEYFDTVPELIERPHNRMKKQTVEEQEVNAPTDPKTLKKLQKQRDKSYVELAQREQRANKMMQAAEHFQQQKNLLSKGKRVKVQDGDGDRPPMFKWKAERKR
eukprot:gb/GECG01015284.1/.p1 GENE.gb/GECG01015284.1/~~gb/GECG01015284.1/.p1  ORF type:complete len:250 (+),score=51.81 gb/GECG01015284.1/:1-750(+)